ncbi:hypothetical protein NDA13_005463 [Ustilago tritici]|nr:hypothetical protein NDA13_005463 [Ustilago tritici]
MPMGTPTGYSTEQGSSQFTRAMPQSQGQRSANFAPGISPSVLSPGTGYGHNAIYAAGGAQQQQEQHQQRMNAQEMQRQAQASMSGMQGVSPVEQMQGMQLRMTTPYDGCSYGEPMMQGAPGQPLMEAASAIYHHQPLQQGGSYAFAQTPSQRSHNRLSIDLTRPLRRSIRRRRSSINTANSVLIVDSSSTAIQNSSLAQLQWHGKGGCLATRNRRESATTPKLKAEVASRSRIGTITI